MGNKKRIIVNATGASKKSTGIGTFTKEIVSSFITARPDLFYILGVYDFLNGFEHMKIIPESCSPDHGSSGHSLRILWSQLMLPLEYKLRSGDLLFSTMPEAPISIKNKVVVVHDIIPVKFPEIQSRMKYYFYYVVPLILKTSRYLVFDSENTKNDVFEFYKIKNIPNSVIQPGYNKKYFYPMERGYIKKKI